MTNGFVVTSPSVPSSEPKIVSSTFWPVIDPVNIRAAQRIDGTIPPERLRMALIEAIATTNYALRDWQALQLAAGRMTLTQIDAEKIDDVSILVHRYQRAVGCLAKALLLERYRDFDLSGKGEKKAEALTDPIDDCRRDHLNALADISGKSRCQVELI